MTKKRRIFDIDLPDETTDETFTAVKVSDDKRRGPMAAAITENADSLRERAEVEAQIRHENDALAHEHVRLKKAGLIVDMVPLDAIDTSKLTRDRHKGFDDQLHELVLSIRDIGLSNPIRVEPRPDGRFELVQGFRRLSAYRALLDETGDAEAWGKIPAGMIARGDALETLYRRMVDENMVRKDISYAEMARLALHYAADPETAVSDPDKAVAVLFQSASYAKRSHIRTFIKVMERLGDDLEYPYEIPRALGLALAEKLDAVPGLAHAIREQLKGWDGRSILDELDVLRSFVGGAEKDIEAGKPAGQGGEGGPLPAAKTTFQIVRPQGKAKCVAGAGRLEIRLDRDFSRIDRQKLEHAVRSLLDMIE